jgi:uncharacterized SAM-binding protein YcdF (DUF218 family)
MAWIGVVAGLVSLVAFTCSSWVSDWLVVNEPLEHAAAIVVLDGGSPEREREAARLYASGWAPRVVLVPGLPHADTMPEWSGRFRLLEHFGVPSDAIVVADGQARRTLDELRLAEATIGPNAESVILVTSSLHTRRAATIWALVSARRGIVRAAVSSAADREQAAAHELLGLVALVGQAPGLL